MPKVFLDYLALSYRSELYKLIDENRDHLRPWFPWVDTTRAESDTRQFIERMQTAREKQTAVCTVILVEEKLAGLIDLHGIDETNRRASMGYWLGKPFEGRGIVTMAVKAFLEYGFLKRQLERIEILVQPENYRSLAIPERLGFTREGTLRHYQRYGNQGYFDLMVYSLLSDEYAQNHLRDRTLV